MNNFEETEPKYFKKSAWDISKSKKKSKHKHDYSTVIIIVCTHKEISHTTGKHYSHASCVKVCSICGKIGDIAMKDYTFVKDSNMPLGKIYKPLGIKDFQEVYPNAKVYKPKEEFASILDIKNIDQLELA